VTEGKKEKRRFGKLEPRYTFVLNPYSDVRFSTCPGCGRRTKQRKLPLLIHIDPQVLLTLNKTCRYCPDCDLLIAHQDEIEGLLAAIFTERDPSVVGNDYLVLGTVERKAWRKGAQDALTIAEMLDNLHDFKAVHKIEYRPAGWYPDAPDDSTGKDTPDDQHPPRRPD